MRVLIWLIAILAAALVLEDVEDPELGEPPNPTKELAASAAAAADIRIVELGEPADELPFWLWM